MEKYREVALDNIDVMYDVELANELKYSAKIKSTIEVLVVAMLLGLYVKVVWQWVDGSIMNLIGLLLLVVIVVCFTTINVITRCCNIVNPDVEDFMNILWAGNIKTLIYKTEGVLDVLCDDVLEYTQVPVQDTKYWVRDYAKLYITNEGLTIVLPIGE